jgi:hypothetical protein
MTCLGAGFPTSWWENRSGHDFLIETQARTAAGPDYWRLVQRLEWLAIFHGENGGTPLLKNCFPDKSQPWMSLAVIQRNRLVISLSTGTCAAKQVFPTGPPTMTQMEKLVARIDTPEEISVRKDGTILIPATSCSNPSKPNNGVLFLKSFLGGQQLHFTNNTTVEYTLTPDQLSSSLALASFKKLLSYLFPTADSDVQEGIVGGTNNTSMDPIRATKFNMVWRVCTVHRNEAPLLVKVSAVGGGSSSEYSITLPYSMGMWQETAPLPIDVGDCHSVGCVLSITRQSSGVGIAIKDIKLVPA